LPLAYKKGHVVHKKSHVYENFVWAAHGNLEKTRRRACQVDLIRLRHSGFGCNTSSHLGSECPNNWNFFFLFFLKNLIFLNFYH
jgi:hypothetical protein